MTDNDRTKDGLNTISSKTYQREMDPPDRSLLLDSRFHSNAFLNHDIELLLAPLCCIQKKNNVWVRHDQDHV